MVDAKGAILDDKKDCYGRATVALTRAIQLTYVLSPSNMAVYHTGFYTLRHREVREHGCAIVPMDSAAVLEWYRSPLWLCTAHEGHNLLVNRNRGSRIDFLRAVNSNQIRILKGLHFFDARRLIPVMLNVPELQENHEDDDVTSVGGDSDTIEDI